MKRCIVNVGLYRSGTTTLVKAAGNLRLATYRAFLDLPPDQLKNILQDPERAVSDWFSDKGEKEIAQLARKQDVICDGWIALLPFLETSKLERLQKAAESEGIKLTWIATTRGVESTVKSELQHWVMHDLERKAKLSVDESRSLENDLRMRAEQHSQKVDRLEKSGFLRCLPLNDSMLEAWPAGLALISEYSKEEWSKAFADAGKNNQNPSLPTEGILLTMRFGQGGEAALKLISIQRLLTQLEQDNLCRYLLVLAIDADEMDSAAANTIIQWLGHHVSTSQQLLSYHLIENPIRSADEPFPICSIWENMAIQAWDQGADWVLMLGDDVDVLCPFHYRAIYRSFLDISDTLGVPFGFGCPWWNDTTFPGFPTFPCVGKMHYEIFGALIPEHRKSSFVNQDFDPYVHHLYLKFNAAPCLLSALLSNGQGGNMSNGLARYKRVPAEGWRDFFLEDIYPIRAYLKKNAPVEIQEKILLDIIVPSYRVQLEYLRSICELQVPEEIPIHTFFIIIIDNTEALRRAAKEIDPNAGGMSLSEDELILQRHLSSFGNNVRVRYNSENLGASASRNRGLDESTAEFVLHLDDDLRPKPDLLKIYGEVLVNIDDTVVGLVGLVRFPRSPDLPLKHAAVLMSYLTFMFEIAERDMYKHPAWGVTANILFRRTAVRFDLAFAKTGGGEDVDYALRVAKACAGGKIVAVPNACVVHPFWPGSVLTLAKHFFSWAIGDGALFKRHPEYRYWSFPNASEMLLLMTLTVPWIGRWKVLKIFLWIIVADIAIDKFHFREYNHRCLLVGDNGNYSLDRSRVFYFFAHILANIYVIVLECGRIWGHLSRMEPWHGLFQRFDWHCGRLENAPFNFRKREAMKFGLFVVVLAYEFSEWI